MSHCIAIKIEMHKAQVVCLCRSSGMILIDFGQLLARRQFVLVCCGLFRFFFCLRSLSEYDLVTEYNETIFGNPLLPVLLSL